MRFVAIIVLSIIVFSSCKSEKEVTVSSKPIEKVLSEHTDRLMTIPGVVGTAQGLCEGKPCIKVLVNRKTPDLEKRVPKTLEGWDVVIEVVGDVKAL